jgi:predicted RNA-binding Zn ribbon-like protein
MDALELNPGAYDGTYKLIGGEVSLDLVNTISWPGTAREHDWLDRAGNVTAWAIAAGVMDRGVRHALEARRPAVVAADLREVHRVRAALTTVLRPLARRERPPQGGVHRLSQLLAEACRRRRIDPATLDWAWEHPGSLSQALAPVIWNAGEVLTRRDHSRLGQCPSCGWLYFDTTRNRSRRWCDMADCGSRDKALRYYHRAKAQQRKRPPA